MDINSTDDEKYEEIKDREITIVKWDESKEINIFDPTMSISKSLYNQAQSLGLIQKYFNIEGLSTQVKFNKKSLNESIASMCRQQSDLMSLSKLLTVLDKVLINAIQVDIEKYNHIDRRIAKDIFQVRQYISGFCDDIFVYPVKASIFEKNKTEDSNIHVIITVGKIKKEALPNVRVHSSDIDEESLSNRTTSFTISIKDFISFFNREQGVLIKNIPSKLLNPNQLKIKEKIIKIDLERQAKKVEIHNQMHLLRQQEKALENERYNYDYDDNDYNYENCNDYDDHDDDFDLDL